MTQNEILLKHLSTVFDPELGANIVELGMICLLYTSPSPRD